MSVSYYSFLETGDPSFHVFTLGLISEIPFHNIYWIKPCRLGEQLLRSEIRGPGCSDWADNCQLRDSVFQSRQVCTFCREFCNYFQEDSLERVHILQDQRVYLPIKQLHRHCVRAFNNWRVARYSEWVKSQWFARWFYNKYVYLNSIK